jgi:hypothetical protein
MIKRKEKFETPHLVFWLTEYEQPNMYDYDIIFGGNKVAPQASKKELKDLADFIHNFINQD